MNRLISPIFALAILAVSISFLTPAPANAEAPDRRVAVSERHQSNGDRYQIVRATEQRVWRLDKTSGEITVCAFKRDRLVCAKSTDAAVAPKRSYEELEQEQHAKKAKDREAQLAMLDRMMMLFRELVAYSIEQDEARAE